MNTLCRPLNITIPFLKENFNKKKYSTARHQLLDKNEISLDYLTWIKSLGLVLDLAEVFFSVPHTYYTIHQDQYTRTDFPKINFIYGGSNSFMNWYKIKTGKTGIESQTNMDTAYVEYTLDEVDLIYSEELKAPSLVQAGIPHNVTILGSARWCVSTVYTYPNKQLASWSELISILKPYL